ncbi:MAG: DUF473 family protein [Methermicoccaceae archaeon]
MKYVAITGISQEVVLELAKGRVRTIEIQSPHNFFVVLRLTPGDTVFLSSTSLKDVMAGTKGILAKVVEKSIFMHRSFQCMGLHKEECEHLCAQIQLRAKSFAVVRTFEPTEVGAPLVVDVGEIPYFDAH